MSIYLKQDIYDFLCNNVKEKHIIDLIEDYLPKCHHCGLKLTNPTAYIDKNKILYYECFENLECIKKQKKKSMKELQLKYEREKKIKLQILETQYNNLPPNSRRRMRLRSKILSLHT
jgi:hypothetical protein